MKIQTNQLTGFAIALFSLTACGGGQQAVIGEQSNDSPGSGNHQDTHIAYSQVEAGVWPPQPVDISNARTYVNINPSDSIREIKHAAALDLAMQNEVAVHAIGTRFEVLGSYTTGDKSDPFKTTEHEIFNYNTNQVVTVTVDRNNTVTVSQAPASDYQPAETAAESVTAISIAAGYLQSLGHDTTDLQGAALLAHPTAQQVATTGKQFHAHRLIYVTFGYGAGTTPLFRATVDLSQQTVIDGGPL